MLAFSHKSLRDHYQEQRSPFPACVQLTLTIWSLNRADLWSTVKICVWTPRCRRWLHQLLGFGTGICSFIISICLTGTIREQKSGDACLGIGSVLYPDHTFRLGRKTVMYKALVDLTLCAVLGGSNCQCFWQELTLQLKSITHLN